MNEFFVITYIANHILIKELDTVNAASSRDNFNAWCIAAIACLDRGARMVFFKCIADAQQDICLTQAFSGTRVDGFHAQIG